MPNGAPRIEGFDYRGVYFYSLTVCVSGRRPRLTTPDLVNEILDQILRHGRECGFALLAYCAMPDHLHLLVQGTRDTSDLRSFVRAWKQATGWAFKRRHGVRLWQTGYFDHVLRGDESIHKHAAYIVGNPVRAGLKASVGDYPFAQVFCENGPSPEASRHRRTGSLKGPKA